MGSMSLKKSYFVVLFANFEKGTGEEYWRSLCLLDEWEIMEIL